MTDTLLVHSYQFNFPDKDSIELCLKIESSTMTLQADNNDIPFWALLGFEQCSNCPLDVENNAVCPVAHNLIPLLKVASSLVSHDEVNVIITTPDRVISADTTMQRAMSSILGLIMATSPCPHTEFLKPMARFHLPLASQEETIYRSTSMYLLAQHFRAQQNMSYEIDFKGLTEHYASLTIINRALANRIRSAIKQDATVNAIILLDLLSQAVTWPIEDQLDELQPFFNSYFSQ